MIERGETRIILVRHGETEWNQKHIFQGASDIPLNETGRIQAGFARDALRDTEFDEVFSSPLERAMETGTIITEGRGLTVQPEDGIREIYCGKWEGMLAFDIMEKFPEQYHIWRTAPSRVGIEGAETLAEVQERVLESMRRIAADNRGKTILVTAHMVSISSLMLKVAGHELDDMWKYPITNGSINELSCSAGGRWEIVRWSDDRHIPAENRLARPFGDLKKWFQEEK